MVDQHPDRRLLELFMRGDLQAAESKDIVIHLLAGCEACRRIARESFPFERDSQSADQLPDQWQADNDYSYDRIFENVLPAVWKAESELDRERAEAANLVAELERHPHERRLMLVRNTKRFGSAQLVEKLLARVRSLGSEDPNASVQMAELTLEIAESLQTSGVPRTVASDLEARAHAILGNALRIRGDLRDSAKQFSLANTCLENGTGDGLTQARVAELQSHLAGLQRDFETALGLLDLAAAVYKRLGDRHRLGRALISKGFHLSEKGDVKLAIGSLRKGIKNIDPCLDPRLELVAKHNLLSHLYETGRYHQAIAMIPETRNLHSKLGSKVDLVRFQWLVGQIMLESGQIHQAEEELMQVKEYFLNEGIAHDTALVSLDLATIYLKQGRLPELKNIASEMLSVFSSLRINREAIAALVLFQKAVELERATFSLVRDLSAYLKNSRNEANLPFRPSTRQ